jgi:hypothetical protein
MLAPRFVMPYAYWPDAAGVPLPGALLYFYVSGTDDPAPTYADAALTQPNRNPIAANAAGFWPNIFLEPGTIYKVVLTEENGAEIWTADPVSPTGNFFGVPFEYLAQTPIGSACLGGMWLPVGVTFPANFNGSGGYCLVNPAASFVASIHNQNGEVLGQMTISTGGAFSFVSTGAAAVSMNPGDSLIVTGPAVADMQIQNFWWTFFGVPSQ